MNCFEDKKNVKNSSRYSRPVRYYRGEEMDRIVIDRDLWCRDNLNVLGIVHIGCRGNDNTAGRHDIFYPGEEARRRRRKPIT